MKYNPLNVTIGNDIDEKELKEVRASWDNLVYDVSRQIKRYSEDMPGRNQFKIRIEMEGGPDFAFIARISKCLSVLSMGFVRDGSLDPNISYEELKTINKYALNIVSRLKNIKPQHTMAFDISVYGIYEEPEKVNLYKPEGERNIPEDVISTTNIIERHR